MLSFPEAMRFPVSELESPKLKTAGKSKSIEVTEEKKIENRMKMKMRRKLQFLEGMIDI